MEQDKEILEYTVNMAKENGANDIIAKLVNNKEYQIRFSNSQIDIFKQWNNHFLEVFLDYKKWYSIGHKISVISIQNPTKEKIQQQISESMNTLKNLPKNLLYWGMDKREHSYEQMDGLHDTQIATFSESAPLLVKSAIDSALGEGVKKVAGVLYFGEQKNGVLTGYENGGMYKSSYYRMTIRSFLGPESNGQDIVVGRDLSNIEEKFNKAGKNSGKLAAMAEDGEQGEAGTYDLILSPPVAANIFNYLLDGANPVYIIGGMSCLKGKMDEKIGPQNLSVSDDATIPEGLNSRPFDFEGTPSQKTPLIQDGKLMSLIQNTSSAKIWRLLHILRLRFWKTFQTTGNSYLGGFLDESLGPRLLAPIPSNYIYKPGNYTLEEMIEESTDPTVWVTSNWYTRFTNYVEGTFSTIPRDGMFLIENGEIVKPIRKLRITETLLGMCERINAIGKKIKQIKWWEVNTPTFIPNIKVEKCRLTAATR
ncbi:MAG: metallopeptidase TldD-related protein [Promethearchaeia archaeon]